MVLPLISDQETKVSSILVASPLFSNILAESRGRKKESFLGQPLQISETCKLQIICLFHLKTNNYMQV